MSCVDDCQRDPATVDLGAWYRSARTRITSHLDDRVGGLAVPATPGWNVHDLVAHLAGIATDAVTGNMEGVTTDAWTAAQVERGRGRSVTELVAEWEAGSPFVEAFLTSTPPDEATTVAPAVIDIHTHEADLLAALGFPVVLPIDVLAWCADKLRQGFRTAVADAGLAHVDVETDNLEWFRGRLGRRTTDEVCGYDWSLNPEPYLDCWFVFGRADESLGERAE